MSASGKCYLCENDHFRQRPGVVRDRPDLQVLECCRCGLVFLSSFTHVRSEFYEDSGMHGVSPPDVRKWLNDTAWDDERRFRYLETLLPNRSVLDFGCGAGGFLLRAREVARTTAGIELERRLAGHFRDHSLTVFPDIQELKERQPEARFDLITLFHVLEHLPDPRALLGLLADLLRENGQVLVEVPSADDALLTLYESDAFSRFTYWSCHLFLFTARTLERLVTQAGLRLHYLKQVQRYPLANHLHWLSKGKPGGHQVWHFLDTPELRAAYEKSLAAIGRCDTLLASLFR